MIQQTAHDKLRVKPRREVSRRGFTILEVVLVLAIITAMAAVVYPIIDNSLQTDSLRRSGDRVQASLRHARVLAMHTGVTHVFRYEAETPYYIIEPWQDEYSEVESRNPNQLSMDTGGMPSLGLLTDVPISENPDADELFNDVVFVASSVQSTSRTLNLLAGSGDEPIIFFYPDGTATDATLALRVGSEESGDDIYVEVRLNGVTGLTKRSGLLLAGELEVDQ